MKKVLEKTLKNNKIYYTIVGVFFLIYIVMMYTGGIPVIYQCNVQNDFSGPITPSVMPSSTKILIYNILIILIILATLFTFAMLNKKDKLKYIIAIVFLILAMFVPIRLKDNNYERGKKIIILDEKEFKIEDCEAMLAIVKM